MSDSVPKALRPAWEDQMMGKRIIVTEEKSHAHYSMNHMYETRSSSSMQFLPDPKSLRLSTSSQLLSLPPEIRRMILQELFFDVQSRTGLWRGAQHLLPYYLLAKHSSARESSLLSRPARFR